MRDSLKVWAMLVEKLRFFWKMGMGTPWHVQVFVECARLQLPSDIVMQRALVWLAQRGYITLTTWNNSLCREAHYWEYPTAHAFFYNRDDANYVRVKPLVSF